MIVECVRCGRRFDPVLEGRGLLCGEHESEYDELRRESGVFVVSGRVRVTYLADVNDTGHEEDLELESCVVRAEGADLACDIVLVRAGLSYEHILDAVWIGDPEVREIGEDEYMRLVSALALFDQVLADA